MNTINIIRLFLGDIILEILFDIIFLSVFFYGYIWLVSLLNNE